MYTVLLCVVLVNKQLLIIIRTIAWKLLVNSINYTKLDFFVHWDIWSFFFSGRPGVKGVRGSRPVGQPGFTGHKGDKGTSGLPGVCLGWKVERLSMCPHHGVFGGCSGITLPRTQVQFRHEYRQLAAVSPAGLCITKAEKHINMKFFAGVWKAYEKQQTTVWVSRDKDLSKGKISISKLEKYCLHHKI